MKYLLLVPVFTLPMLMVAQKRPEHRFRIKAKPNIISGILDTSHMYASRYGQVARLTLDNMPCMLPEKSRTSIPNALEGRSVPSDIPNAWKLPEKSRYSGKPDSNYTKPLQRLQWKNGLPFIDPRDSLARLIMPVDGALHGVVR